MNPIAFDEAYRITRYLPYRDVMAFCNSNRAYAELCEDDRFWKERARDNYGIELSRVYGMLSYSRRYQLVEYMLDRWNTMDQFPGDDALKGRYDDLILSSSVYMAASILRYRHGVFDAETVITDIMHEFSDIGEISALLACFITQNIYFKRVPTIQSVYADWQGIVSPFNRKYDMRYGLKDWYKRDRVPISFDLASDVVAIHDEAMPDTNDLFEDLAYRMVDARRYDDLLVIVDLFMPYNEDTMDSIFTAIMNTLLPAAYDAAFYRFARTLFDWRHDPSRGMWHSNTGIFNSLADLPDDVVARMVVEGWFFRDELEGLEEQLVGYASEVTEDWQWLLQVVQDRLR